MPAAKLPQCTYSVRTRIAICRQIGTSRNKNAGNMHIWLDCDLGATSVILKQNGQVIEKHLECGLFSTIVRYVIISNNAGLN